MDDIFGSPYTEMTPENILIIGIRHLETVRVDCMVYKWSHLTDKFLLDQKYVIYERVQ